MPKYFPCGFVALQMPSGELRFLLKPSDGKATEQARRVELHVNQVLHTPLGAAALSRLCEKGCDRHVLFEMLLRFASLKLKPSVRLYRKSERRELEGIVTDMKSLSVRLRDPRWYEMMAFFATFPKDDALELSNRLEIDATRIANALESVWKNAYRLSGMDNLVILENYIREQATRPHFNEIAILLSAIYRRQISPEELRSRIRTHQRSSKRVRLVSGRKMPKS